MCSIGNPHVLFVAHVDTVGGQLPVTKDEHNIYGRGACDNKGSLAAMIECCHQAVALSKNNFGLLITVGEESSFDGAKVAATYFQKKNIKPKFVVIGEPTQLEVVTGQRGVLCIEFKCTGQEAHSSVEKKDSAIHKLVELLHTLSQAEFAETSMNIGLISGGKAENIVAPSALATIAWRSSLSDIHKKIEVVLSNIHISHTATIRKNLPPIDRVWPQFERNIVSFFSEMFFFENSIVTGPGSINVAHSSHEHISRTELCTAVEHYLSLL